MRVRGVVAAFALILLGHSRTWGSQYNILDLNTLLGSHNSGAQAINNSGEITGSAFSSTGFGQAFIYDGSAVHFRRIYYSGRGDGR